MVVHKNDTIDVLMLDGKNLSDFLDKYMFICIVLEILVEQKYYFKEDSISLGFLHKRIRERINLSLYRRSVALSEKWVKDMEILGLIEITPYQEEHKNLFMIRMTGEGKAAYDKQTFQQIYSNLLSAKQSRVLSYIALIVSLLSLFMSLIRIF